MHITDAVFTSRPEEGDPAYPLVVVGSAAAGDIEHRAVPFVAQVGDVELEYVLVDADGSGFRGLLRRAPQVGDELLVGYLDEPLEATGFTFNPPIV